MSIDRLQSKIRKMKSPIVLDLQLDKNLIPTEILEKEKTFLNAFVRYAVEMMETLKETVPAVRLHFSEFTVWGTDGVAVLVSLLNMAKKLGYYVILNGPEALSAQQASNFAEAFMETGSQWQFDGVVLSQFIGTDAIKPYAALQKKSGKGIFAIVRTGNKSGPEMQDLITGGRLVHMAQADLVHRIAEPNLGRSGFCTIGVMAAATNSASLQNIRSRFKYLFILIDGYDASNANAKNCAPAFDNLGHGAAVCVGSSITAAWKEAQDGESVAETVLKAAERAKKNICRYITVL